jgi:thiol-disulfide isomerase/thioredoxin
MVSGSDDDGGDEDDNGGGDNAPLTVSMFRADWCPHCKRFAPEWERFKSAIASDRAIAAIEYDAGTPAAKAKETALNVMGYPTIVVEHRGVVKTYSGPRTASALLEYCRSMLKSVA